MPGSALGPRRWRAVLDRALKRARRLKPDASHADHEDLVRRAVEWVFREGGPGWTEGDPKLVLYAIRKRMLNLAGKDTQRFDPTGTRGEALDDDTFQPPDAAWRPGHIPNPQALLLAKEQHEQGTARMAKLLERFKGDELALILIDPSYEKNEAKAAALRKDYTESQVNDARWRLRRHLNQLLKEESKR